MDFALRLQSVNVSPKADGLVGWMDGLFYFVFLECDDVARRIFFLRNKLYVLIIDNLTDAYDSRVWDKFNAF